MGRLGTQGAPCFGQLAPDLVFDAVALLPGQLQRLPMQLLSSPVGPHDESAAWTCDCSSGGDSAASPVRDCIVECQEQMAKHTFARCLMPSARLPFSLRAWPNR